MGVVPSCQDGMVTVSCRRREACGACASRDNCATATVAGLMSRDVTVRIPKEPGSLFQPGQLVVVEAEEGLLLRTILLLLVLPVLFLLAGALAGSYLDPADQGDVRGELLKEADTYRLRLPPSLRNGQQATELYGV